MNSREIREKTSASENRMGTAPVGKLMVSMGLPMIVSMMLQAVYNIVDSAFVSNIPEVGEAPEIDDVTRNLIASTMAAFRR